LGVDYWSNCSYKARELRFRIRIRRPLPKFGYLLIIPESGLALRCFFSAAIENAKRFAIDYHAIPALP